LDNNSRQSSTLTQTIIQLVENKRPQSVQQLVNLVSETTSLPEQKILEQIIQLQNEKKIALKETPKPIPQELSTYLTTTDASWYLLTIILAATTTITIFTIPEDAYPLVYIRFLLGTLFVIWLPGYSLTKALFPTDPPFKTSSKTLDAIERLALSIGLSFTLVPIVGLILHYTPFGLRQTPIVLSLLILTMIFATVAIIRKHQSQLKEKPSTSQVRPHVN
jgi:hypothetical protein